MVSCQNTWYKPATHPKEPRVYSKKGGTGRRAAVEKLVSSLGGQVESMYYAFGENDVFVILDFPDQISIAAVSMAVKTSGTLDTRATVLLTPEEMDRAVQKSVDFRSPGG